MDATTTRLYISLLEKTNEQLNLLSNPYGFLVSVLSFLVGFLAIAVAIILYRQSREYRQSYKKALKDYEIALQENLKKIGLDAESKIQVLIDAKTKEVENLTGDTKKEAKKIIDDLKKEKEVIGSRIQFSSIQKNQYEPLLTNQINYPLKFDFDENNKTDWSILGRGNYCQKCGLYTGSTGTLVVSGGYCSNCGNKL